MSSARQRDESDSPASQRQRLQQAGATAFYEDLGVSGFKLDQRRKATGYQRLISDVRAGQIDRLLTVRLDRAARRDSIVMELADACEAAGIEFLTLAGGTVDTTSASGWLSVKMQLVIAEHFSRQLSENIRHGYRGLHDQGIPARSSASLPIQFQREVGTRHGVVPSDAWPDCRHVIDEFLADRMNLANAAQFLHQRHGRLGHGRSVGIWLRGQHLLGHMARRDGAIQVRDCWPALVNASEFLQIQQRLQENRRLWGVNARRDPATGRLHREVRPLSGLCTCYSCGRTLAYSVARRPSGDYAYIRCAQQACPSRRAGIRADRLEEALVMQWLGDHLHHVAQAQAEAAGIRIPSSELIELRQELRAREALPSQFRTSADADRIRQLQREIEEEGKSTPELDPGVVALLDKRLRHVPVESGWGQTFANQIHSDHWGWFSAPGMNRSEQQRHQDLNLLVRSIKVDTIAKNRSSWIRQVSWRLPVWGSDGPMDEGEVNLGMSD